MDNNYNKFRRAAFGGFNREDVISYIEKMKNEFFDYKKEVEQTVSQLNSKIRELEATFDKEEACETPEVSCEEIIEANPVSDINEATQKLRMVADELCKNLCDFMERVSENAVSVVIEKKAEENGEETVYENEEILHIEQEEEPEEEKEDKVSSILRFTDSFSCNDVQQAEEAEEEKAEEKKNILDVLGGVSFLK